MKAGESEKLKRYRIRQTGGIANGVISGGSGMAK